MGQEMISRLTERQRTCLKLVAMGFTSKQIARQLGISHSTVDNHVLAATQLLGVTDRREAGRLLTRGLGQELPRQVKSLSDAEKSDMMGALEALSPPAPTSLKLLPPIGGEANSQSLGRKTIQILMIAFLSTVAVLSMALLVSGAFRTFS